MARQQQPPDPDPDRTPGLDPGGGVPPGETPPDSASATEATTFTTRPGSRSAKWIWLVLLAVVVLLVAGFFVFRVVIG
ncbi:MULTISPECIES: DUF6480 family protein [Saccharopolyspora]|uniref:DUF6480 family protein n=1 Tax=Saccharopolyspora cebuensis TaxID=418759 RepID=A0ABV4CN67_9PSEU